MLRRLSKGDRWGSKGLKWYCAMNSWDETQASCASPQEQLFDCKWNLGGRVKDTVRVRVKVRDRVWVKLRFKSNSYHNPKT
jgi:hypothetical protein